MDGTSRWLVDDERSRRRDGTSATWVKADDRYGGTRPFKVLYVSTAAETVAATIA